MKNFSSYLIVMFMLLFWLFQVVGAVTATFDIDIGIPVININYQIPIIFASFVCILLVIKRNIIGAIGYLVIHGWYYGMHIYNSILNSATMGLNDYIGAMISFIGVILPIVCIFELLFDKNKQKHGGDKKTDWYYATDEYDRKYDDRADKNNYRTM